MDACHRLRDRDWFELRDDVLDERAASGTARGGRAVDAVE